MTFNPSSTIYLCHVPIDNTYKNQLRFKSLDEQFEYFYSKVNQRHIFTNYLTVRKTNADGSMVSSVKVQCNIDDLYNCNYMFYQNANHGTKWFYAFITKLIYINEGTTEIVFECDVWQTWFKDITLLDSFVVREHSSTDEIGGNVIPEPFSCEIYHYTETTIETALHPKSDGSSNWGYLVLSSEPLRMPESTDGVLHCGIYQGLHFYFFEKASEIDAFISEMEDETNGLVSITLIPKMCLGGYANPETGYVYGSSTPTEHSVHFGLDKIPVKKFDGYTPKNNKLYTSPFLNLVVTNHNKTNIYNFEDFSNNVLKSEGNVYFSLYGDISANPSVMLIPKNYKGIEQNVDESMVISNFPQCSTNTDSYKLWLAKNQWSLTTSALDIGGKAAMTALSIGAGVATGGVATLAMAGYFISSASTIAGVLNDAYKASKEPNQYSAGSGNNLLTALKLNRFDFYIRYPKREFVEMVDNYFTMFGYAVNNVKSVDVFSRPFYNYVETKEINITGGIPDDDMVKIKNMFNNGVTFWDKSAQFGNYNMDEQDNRPQ